MLHDGQCPSNYNQKRQLATSELTSVSKKNQLWKRSCL